MKSSIYYTRKIVGANKNHRISLPPATLQYLGVTYGDELIISVEDGKHGRFLALWAKGDDNSGDNS